MRGGIYCAVLNRILCIAANCLRFSARGTFSAASRQVDIFDRKKKKTRVGKLQPYIIIILSTNSTLASSKF